MERGIATSNTEDPSYGSGTQPPHPTFPLTQKLVGHSPNYALALSGKVRESQVWILHTYGLQNLRNSQMQSWAKCNARGHSHFSPGILKVQGCVVPARSNFRINLHITRQRKRNSYFPNGDVGILPPPGRWYNIKGGKAKRMGGPIS